jgi:hypothetical protein
LDVHRDFCEVAIAADGVVRSAARIATRVEAIEVFAQSLVAGDVVGLEATSGSDRIVSILQRHGVRVVVANTPGCARSLRRRPRPTASTRERWPGSWFRGCSMRSGRPMSAAERCGS